MAITQAILNDIDLRYRNTFTTAQKLVWMTEEQNELYEILEIDSAPVNFPLQTDVQFYPIPAGVDIDRIKTVSIQVNDSLDNPEFTQLPFKPNDDNSYAGGLYYTIVGESFFIPNEAAVDDRQIYIYMDTPSSDITTADLSSEPGVPVRYQEMLKLGVLKRIAMARKDTQMYNNYTADYEQKIADIEWKMKMNEPEFRSPVNMMPKHGRSRTGRRAQFVTIRSDSDGDNTWTDISNNTWLSFR